MADLDIEKTGAKSRPSWRSTSPHAVDTAATLITAYGLKSSAAMIIHIAPLDDRGLAAHAIFEPRRQALARRT